MSIGEDSKDYGPLVVTAFDRTGKDDARHELTLYVYGQKPPASYWWIWLLMLVLIPGAILGYYGISKKNKSMSAKEKSAEVHLEERVTDSNVSRNKTTISYGKVCNDDIKYPEEVSDEQNIDESSERKQISTEKI